MIFGPRRNCVLVVDLSKTPVRAGADRTAKIAPGATGVYLAGKESGTPQFTSELALAARFTDREAKQLAQTLGVPGVEVRQVK